MEKTVLEMLGQFETTAQHAELKEQLLHHAQETEQQIRNLERAFPRHSAARSTTRRARRSRHREGEPGADQEDRGGLVDAVILSGAADGNTTRSRPTRA
jgi:ferritin-like metal-binding protein YciE